MPGLGLEVRELVRVGWLSWYRNTTCLHVRCSWGIPTSCFLQGPPMLFPPVSPAPTCALAFSTPCRAFQSLWLRPSQLPVSFTLAFLPISGQVTPVLFEDSYYRLTIHPMGDIDYCCEFDLAQERGKERYSSLWWLAHHN